MARGWASPRPKARPEPFFSSDKVWLYQYILVTGYLFCVPWYWIGGNRRWFWWSVVGSVTIVEVVYFNVQVSAWLNDWYGTFYNLIQAALTTPNTVTIEQFYSRDVDGRLRADPEHHRAGAQRLLHRALPVPLAHGR